MADDSTIPPLDSQRFPAGGRPAVLSFELTGPEGAVVVVAVEQRDPDGFWSPAGAFSMIAPTESTLRVPALKAERRLLVSGDAAHLRVLPPEWFPC